MSVLPHDCRGQDTGLLQRAVGQDLWEGKGPRPRGSSSTRRELQALQELTLRLLLIEESRSGVDSTEDPTRSGILALILGLGLVKTVL